MKIRKALLCVLLLGCLTSCANTPSESGSSSQVSQDSRSIIATLDEMCSYLEGQNVLSGERKEMSASMIGAESGTKYIDYGVELYSYSGDAPDSFQLFGIDMQFDATNGKFALAFSSGTEKDDKIIDCFNGARTK